ncbi:hypothetical protein C1H46_019895 [Malus baccata]|uniref:Uncharacterized protein n=1 Tax=Malus baccata TaxID=106549 RepID=A0A540M6U6_MALBA|nr:hypothetical protein C1H46_019895 [Malus baccata]
MADIPPAGTSNTQVPTTESAVKFTPLALSVWEPRSGRRIHQSETARRCANPAPVGDVVEADANSATMPPTETENSQLREAIIRTRCLMLAPIRRKLAPEVHEAMKKEINLEIDEEVWSEQYKEWKYEPHMYYQTCASPVEARPIHPRVCEKDRRVALALQPFLEPEISNGLGQRKGREFRILEAGRVRELGKYFSSTSQPPSGTSCRLQQVEMKLEAMHQLEEEVHQREEAREEVRQLEEEFHQYIAAMVHAVGAFGICLPDPPSYLQPPPRVVPNCPRSHFTNYIQKIPPGNICSRK